MVSYTPLLGLQGGSDFEKAGGGGLTMTREATAFARAGRRRRGRVD